MTMITTEAWVLHRGPTHTYVPGELVPETFTFPAITDTEVLAEPLYGCWEANMTHAIERRPVDICRQRREEKIVLGNAGVVRVLQTGTAVTKVKAGDICLIVAIGTTDPFGYMIKVFGYDAPGTVGVLARQIKAYEYQLIPLPSPSRHSLPQWAAFSLRYLTAWTNWKLAYGCWRLQMSEEDFPLPYVWGWGGGVTLAELDLAKYQGAHVAMMASTDERLALIERMGITPIDRRAFKDLQYDDHQYRTDVDYRTHYQKAEHTFVDLVSQATDGYGVSIFIDNIGRPVFRATLKALGPQGVITTSGWKHGMELSFIRAIECIRHHIHVHTHGARYTQAVAATRFAEETNWMPPLEEHIYCWEDIPQLVHDYANDRIASYFPIFQINPV